MSLSLGTRTLAYNRVSERTPTSSGRGLVWDSKNTSSVLVARALRARGWAVDWIGAADSPCRESDAFDGKRFVVSGFEDPALESILWDHPADALFLHGDDQVRWLLERWTRLPPSLRRHLPEREAQEIALSKGRSMQVAKDLGVPVLETAACRSPSEVALASQRLAPGGQVVMKGEGACGGVATFGLRAGREPRASEWRAVTRHAPLAMVQRRLRGPRFLVTVVYEHGTERAACGCEKVAAWPTAFGPAALAVTRHVEAVHDYTQRIFGKLGWHGLADIEFRQDLEDGHWYFMEINPRVPATLGIEARAGMDVIGAWAAVCAGRGAEEAPGRNYRDGVRYAWGTRLMALAMRSPWKVPRWGWSCLASDDCDLEGLDPTTRRQMLRNAMWIARHS